MRKLFLGVLVFLGAQNLIAADIVCSCSGEAVCSDISINFVPSNPGVYMTIEYAYGEKNTEGFATVDRDRQAGQAIYRLGSFTLLEKGNVYSLPGRQHICR